MIDVFVTIKDRYELACRSLRSFFDSTERGTYRLTVMLDGQYRVVDDPSWGDLLELLYLGGVDHVIQSKDNEGLGPTINRALSHIQTINLWESDQRVGDPSKVSDLIVYCQDDLLYTDGWLERLSREFYRLERACKLGFASGLECVEHKMKAQLPGGLLLKDWIRAAQMMARREYWMSMWPITKFDPETGRQRAKPNDGIGSGVDWHFIRNHENSVCRTGRTCLVIPGLVQHLGYDQSTWLDRELPESDSDKEKMR